MSLVEQRIKIEFVDVSLIDNGTLRTDIGYGYVVVPETENPAMFTITFNGNWTFPNKYSVSIVAVVVYYIKNLGKPLVLASLLDLAQRAVLQLDTEINQKRLDYDIQEDLYTPPFDENTNKTFIQAALSNAYPVN